MSSWKKVLEDSFLHITGHYLAIVDENNTAITAALPLYEVNSWITGRRIVSIPFATLSDPLVKNTDELEALLLYATANLNKNKHSCIEITAYESSEIQNCSGFANSSSYINHYLVLEDNPEELLKTVFKTSIRRGVKKALKESIDVIEATDDSDVNGFYSLYVDTRRRLGLPPQPLHFFLNLFNTLSSKGQISIQLAKLKGNIIGGTLLLKYKDRVSVDYLASDERYRGISIDTFLWWMAMKYSWREGYRIFDFGRTSIRNNGLLEYKDRWGTTRKTISNYCNDKGKDTVKENSIFYEPVKQICRHAPRPLLRFIGNAIYRHMG